MEIILETERLLLRNILLNDDLAMFELDSNASVHKYLGDDPIQTLEQSRKIIASILQQYIDNRIGRWAVIEKSSDSFIGWSGLKLIREYKNNHINYYDVGYRLIPKYWGKGYATESAKAAIEYGFTTMNLLEIIGTVHQENKASRRALEKCGLKFIEEFMWENLPCDWLKITKEEFGK